MSESNLSNGWRKFRFDEMATLVNDRVDDPSKANVNHYVGLEHLDSDSLMIRRWGSPTDVEATKLRFRAGDIIFGRRRVYQRKLGVAPFDGICSAHAMVLRTKPEVAVSDFLPFFMQGDLFMDRAKEISVGSLSPTINWKTLADEVFALPPLKEQQRIVSVLQASDETVNQYDEALSALQTLVSALAGNSFGIKLGWRRVELRSLVSKLGSGKTPLGGEAVYVKEGILFLRSQNIYPDGLRLDDVAYIPADVDKEMASTRVLNSDVLVNITGASIGRCGLYDLDLSANVNQHVCILRPKADLLDPWYLNLFIQSDYGQRLIASFMTNGNRQGLNFQQLGSFRIPLPDLDEQRRIGKLARELHEARKVLRIRRASASKMKRVLLVSTLSPK